MPSVHKNRGTYETTILKAVHDNHAHHIQGLSQQQLAFNLAVQFKIQHGSKKKRN